MKTRQNLEKKLRRIENQKSRIIGEYETLKPVQRQFRPGSDEWNLLQVLRHIVTAEQQSLQLIRHKIHHAENLPKAGTGAWIRHLLLKIALWLPIKYKAPKFAGVDAQNPDLENIISDWEEVRSELQQIISDNSADTLSKALYKHPRAGYLDLHQALEFFETHINHHRKQMERIKKSENFPANTETDSSL